MKWEDWTDEMVFNHFMSCEKLNPKKCIVCNGLQKYKSKTFKLKDFIWLFSDYRIASKRYNFKYTVKKIWDHFQNHKIHIWRCNECHLIYYALRQRFKSQTYPMMLQIQQSKEPKIERFNMRLWVPPKKTNKKKKV